LPIFRTLAQDWVAAGDCVPLHFYRMAGALTLLVRTADTSLILMPGHINYRPKSKCQQARSRWALPFPKMETSFTFQQVAEIRLQLSTRRRMKWRQQFPLEIARGE